MPALAHLADAATAEAIAFADLLDKLEPDRRRSPTPCAGWTIDDLAAHVAADAFRHAEAFHRARLGTSSPPGELAIDNVDLAEAIRLSVNHLRSALDHAPARWPIIPMPFGHYPVATALQCLIIEFGVHHNDLAIAAGDADAPFTAATLDAVFSFGDLYLLLQAAPVAAGPLGFTLTAPSKSMSITWDGATWTDGVGDSTAPHCSIAGSDDDVARLMLRRLEITHPRFELDDPAGLAHRFAEAIRPL